MDPLRRMGEGGIKKKSGAQGLRPKGTKDDYYRRTIHTILSYYVLCTTYNTYRHKS